MSRHRIALGWTFVLLIASAGLSTARGAIPLADFESGSLPAGWTTTGNAWAVGGPTGTSPNINPYQGNYFVHSGTPNTLSETYTGTLTSPAYTVQYDLLLWAACGWSTSSSPNTSNRFEILDAGQSVLETVSVPFSDGWFGLSVNLLDIGLQPGDTFYFRAIDTLANQTYSWFAFDAMQMTGNQVPEPAAAALLIGCSLAVMQRRRRMD